MLQWHFPKKNIVGNVLFSEHLSLKFFFDTNYFSQIFFGKFLCLNFFILCFIKQFTKIPVFSKFVPKCHKFYLKIFQISSKIYRNFLKIFSTFFNLHFFEFRENFLPNGPNKKLIFNFFFCEVGSYGDHRTQAHWPIAYTSHLNSHGAI